MKTVFLIMAAVLFTASPVLAESNIYVSQSGGILDVEILSPRACGAIPGLGVRLIGEKNCAKVPVEVDGGVLSATRNQTVTTTLPDGTVVVDTLNIEDRSSTFVSFGGRRGLSLTDTIRNADAKAAEARFFATGAAAQYLGDGAGAYLENSGTHVPSE